MSDDDILESRLRDALRAEAETVVPAGDGLVRIREGIDEGRRPVWWRAPAVALAAVAVAAIALVGGYLVGARDDGGAPPAARSSVTPTVTATPTPSPSPTPSTSTTSAPSPHTYDGVWVYYVKREPGQGLRLYRERHDGVTSTGDESQAALEQVLNQQPTDPDYSSVWSGRTLESYTLAQGHATVRLSGPRPAAADLGLGLQQIVYTLTAVESPRPLTVTLYVDGTPVAGSDTRPAGRASLLAVQGLIWVLAPTQGATVGSPVGIEIYGTANEGTISWEITRRGAVVAQGQVLGETGVLKDLHDTATLAPGTYTISAFEVSQKDGSRVHVDTKEFTVR